MSECVTVCVRCRPFNSIEKKEKRQSIITINRDECQVSITNPDAKEKNENKVRHFTFDAVFDTQSKQRDVYDEIAYPLVEAVLEGFNCTIFAYGQTGCGKTFTMLGPELGQGSPEMWGIIPNCFLNIFDNLRIGGDEGQEYLVQASYLEIYNEKIRDLLAVGEDENTPLQLREHPDKGVYVASLTEIVVESVEAIQQVMNKGAKNRTIGATAMNQGSSRSHSIFTVRIESTSKREDGAESFRVGKLNLVDLAGSERQKKTNASGQRLKEGSNINLSLSALGNVISALVDGKSGKHIPYRDSKLTRLLQTSLGGNTKTAMIAAVGPADYNYEETLSTLRYANRAKNIKNKPVINEDPKDTMLRLMKEEIKALKEKIACGGGGSSNGSIEQSEKLLQKQEEITRQLKDAEARANMERIQREELAQQLAAMQSKVIGKSNPYSPRNVEDDPADLMNRHKSGTRENALLGIPLSQHMKSMQSSSTADLHTVKKRAQERKRTHQEAMKRKRRLKEEKAKRKALRKKAREEAKSAAEALAVVEEICAEKISAAEMEVRDLAREFNQERSSLLRTITNLRQEKRLYEQLAETFLHKKELAKVWQKAKWCEELERWQLPKIQGRTEFKPLPSLKSKNACHSSEKSHAHANVVVKDSVDSDQQESCTFGTTRGVKSKQRKCKHSHNQYINDDWWRSSFKNSDSDSNDEKSQASKVRVQTKSSSRQRKIRKKRDRARKRIQKAYEAPSMSSKGEKEKRGLKPRTPRRDSSYSESGRMKKYQNVTLQPLSNHADMKEKLDGATGFADDVTTLPSPRDKNGSDDFSRILEPIYNNNRSHNIKKKDGHRPVPPKYKRGEFSNKNPRSGHVTVKLGALQGNSDNSSLIAFPAGKNSANSSNTISLNAVFTFHHGQEQHGEMEQEGKNPS